jgi:hypothetical protein
MSALRDYNEHPVSCIPGLSYEAHVIFSLCSLWPSKLHARVRNFCHVRVDIFDWCPGTGVVWVCVQETYQQGPTI